MWAKKFLIRRQKEKRDKPEEVYSDSKIVKVIKTLYELGHEHQFITEIIVRRANGKIGPITEPDYKFLNKNHIEDLYLLCINGKVDNYKETGLLGSLTIFFRSTDDIRDNKKEKRVMIHKEIHKFCDATLKRVMENLKKYNKDVKYEYVDPSFSDADAEYLQIYKEDIKDHLKHRDQMRCWEMYVNGRPLKSRRDPPE
ncbi:hypothetical protein Tco_0397816 [Tanacetum coccineum]